MEILRFIKKDNSLYTVQELNNKYTVDLFFEFYGIDISKNDCIYLKSQFVNKLSNQFVQPLCFKLVCEIEQKDVGYLINSERAVLFVNNTQKYYLLKRIYG